MHGETMSTFDNQSKSIGCVGKPGHLFGFLRHYLLINFNVFSLMPQDPGYSIIFLILIIQLCSFPFIHNFTRLYVKVKGITSIWIFTYDHTNIFFILHLWSQEYSFNSMLTSPFTLYIFFNLCAYMSKKVR